MKNFLPLILLVTVLGCQKEAVDYTPELLSKSWKMTAFTALTPFEGTPLEGMSNNWFNPGTCWSDMTWTYKQDGTFLNEPAASCIPGTAAVTDTLYGKWSLINDNKTIKVEYTHGGFANFELNILELTPTKKVVQTIAKTSAGTSQATDAVIMDLLFQYEFMPK